MEINNNNNNNNNKCGRSKEEVHQQHRQKYERKTIHGQFRKSPKKVRSKMSWEWLKKGYLKKETGSTTVAAQDQLLCTGNLRNAIYRENVESVGRVCDVPNETAAHIASECSKVAQKEYKQVRRDNVAKIIYWNLCKK